MPYTCLGNKKWGGILKYVLTLCTVCFVNAANIHHWKLASIFPELMAKFVCFLLPCLMTIKTMQQQLHLCSKQPNQPNTFTIKNTGGFVEISQWWCWWQVKCRQMGNEKRRERVEKHFMLEHYADTYTAPKIDQEKFVVWCKRC